MNCIYCKNKDTTVTNSRPYQKGCQVWRRRYCSNCDKTFTTKEIATADNIFTIKRSGIRQRFVYEKLLVSIFAVLNSGKNSDNGQNALIAKNIAQNIILEIIQDLDINKNTTSEKIILETFNELQKIGQNFADQYIFYSKYRRDIGYAHQIIKTKPI